MLTVSRTLKALCEPKSSFDIISCHDAQITIEVSLLSSSDSSSIKGRVDSRSRDRHKTLRVEPRESIESYSNREMVDCPSEVRLATPARM